MPPRAKSAGLRRIRSASEAPAVELGYVLGRRAVRAAVWLGGELFTLSELIQ